MAKHIEKSKISIVLCTYNGEQFIKEQLNSILNQTYQVHEIIIQDDCSTDNTWCIISNYQHIYPNLIKTYKNKTNIGPHANFKSAFSRATGDYIAPSDQDDIWYPDKIETLLKTIENQELCFSQEKILFENSEEQISIEMMQPIEKLIWSNNLKGHTFLFKRDLLKFYQYTEELSFDYVLALSTCIRNTYSHTNKVLSVWRRHANVCTFAVLRNSTFNIKQISSTKKMCVSMKKLLLGKSKSPAIMQSFTNRANLIKILTGNDKKLKIISELLKNVAKQSFFSYIKAGYLNIRLLYFGEEFRQYSFKKKIGAILFAFKTPYIYWYDLHLEKSLE